jgi:hypothetical protein
LVNLSQKTPLARTLNDFAAQKAIDAINLLGKALPASVIAVAGSIVSVKFEVQSNNITLPNVTIPKWESQWIRAPTQIGDLGMVIPSDVSLGAISGLGGASAATINLIPNLSALVWLPVASANWTASPDPNSAFINGPNGAILQDTAGGCVVKISRGGEDINGVFTVSIDGTVILTVNSSGIIVAGALKLGGPLQSEAGSTYAEPIQTAGDVITGYGTGDQVSVQNHTHTSSASGDQTSPPTPGT